MISTCNIYNQNSIVTASENRMIFKINNLSKYGINKVQVDGCYMPIASLKCDFLFEIVNNNTLLNVYYVELKGCDIEHAILQLENTLTYCKTIHQNINKECHIVCSRVPSSGPKSQILKKKFFDLNRVILDISTRLKEVTV